MFQEEHVVLKRALNIGLTAFRTTNVVKNLIVVLLFVKQLNPNLPNHMHNRQLQLYIILKWHVMIYHDDLWLALSLVSKFETKEAYSKLIY